MQVNGADQTEAPGTTPSVGSSRLGKDEFVKLMMAQLAHQDPTAPQSNEAFIAQLAQFATVELMQTQNANLEALLIAQAAGNQTAVADLVGKDVMFRTGELALAADGSATPISTTLPEDAGNVVVTIKDESGHVVRSLQLGAHQAGSFDVTWDGRDDAGKPLPAGNYAFEVSATTTDGAVMDGIVSGARGHVDGVSFADGAPVLLVGALQIALGDVVEVREADQARPEGKENP